MKYSIKLNSMFLSLFCEVLILEILFYMTRIVGAVDKTLVCYYNSYSYNRPGDGRFAVDDINPNFCTHMVYTTRLCLDIERNNIRDSNIFDVDNGHEKFTELKIKNPPLKVLITLLLEPYKWDDKHTKLLTNTSHVEAIAGNIVAFLQEYKFDGVNTLFYPSNEDKLGFMNLVKAIRRAFLPFLYIHAVVGSPLENLIDNGYDITSLSRDVDFLFLNAYDFHTSDEEPNRADHHAPLLRRPWDTKNETVDFAVSHWISKGFPPEKIILTISLGGKSWILSSDDSTPPAPSKGPGSPAVYTKENGLMSYFEICFAVINEGWQVFEDPEKRMGPYAVSPARKNKAWVSYDDPAMAVIKSEYIISKGLGGAAVWDVSMDDFRNKCGSGTNPMLTAIRKKLFTVSNITSADIEDLLFRQKIAFIISLIVSSCYFITIICIFYWMFRLDGKHNLIDSNFPDFQI